MTINEQIQADIEALTTKEAQEIRESLTSMYGLDDWTLEEVATQARYWRESKSYSPFDDPPEYHESFA